MIDFDFRSKFVGTNFRPALIMGRILEVVKVMEVSLSDIWLEKVREIILVETEQILIFQLGGAGALQAQHSLQLE